MLDRVLTVVSEPLQRRQAASFDPAMIGDHMIGDAKQPRQRAVVRESTTLTIAKGTNEDLGREVLHHGHTDPPGHIAMHGRAVTLI